MSQKVGRETLYDEVWADPVTEVAKRYGLSDVGLAKLCRTMGIPLPARGYWAKLRAGAKPERTPLPTHGRYRQTVSLTRFGPDAVRESEEIKRRVREIRQVTEAPIGPIDRHPLVVAAAKRLAQGDVKPEKGLVSAPAEVLHVEVTRGSLERAFDLFNALIFEFAKRGSTVEVDAEKKCTVLVIEGTRVELSLTERVRRKEHVDTPEETKAKERYWKLPRYPGSEYPGTPRYDYLATGILTITAGRWPARSWNDTERTPLERRLPEVVSGLILLAKEIREREEQQAREAERRRLAKERYARIMEQRKRERGLFEDLETEASKWERATRLRAYVDAVEHATTLKGELTDELVDWIGWARAKADWLDPMIRVSDLILDARSRRSRHTGGDRACAMFSAGGGCRCQDRWMGGWIASNRASLPNSVYPRILYPVGYGVAIEHVFCSSWATNWLAIMYPLGYICSCPFVLDARRPQMTMLANVAELLKQARREAGLSQEELASRAGVARTTVARMETLAKGDMSVSALVRLLEAAGYDLKTVKQGHARTLEDILTEQRREDGA